MGELAYFELLNKILNEGYTRNDRTNVGTKALFAQTLTFDLSDNKFPLFTSRKMFTKNIIEELLFFISGKTDTNILRNKGVRIWNAHTSKKFLQQMGFPNRKEGDMGPGSGFAYRHVGADF